MRTRAVAMCPSSFCFFFSSLFVSKTLLFKNRSFIYLFIFFCCVGARTFRIANACVCVCVCAWLPKANNNKDPPPKKSETWLSLALQNAKDAVDAFLSPPRFFFSLPSFCFPFFFCVGLLLFSVPKRRRRREKKRSKCRRRRREKKKRERQRHFSSPFRSRMLQCRREAIGGGFKE